VRINQYAPLSELRRTAGNKSISWFWRYTGGMLTWAFYTLLPGRITGGDNYNPFSHTINIYSDVPEVAIHEGAHSKDFTERRYRGTYAFAGMIPLVPLYHEAKATGDTVGYLRDNHDVDGEKTAYRVLYPAYGTYVGGELSRFYVDPAGLLNAAFAVPGHIAGRIKAGKVKDTSGSSDESVEIEGK